MSIDRLREAMHGAARLQVAIGRMEGVRFDKRLLRYNDMVEGALRYAMCATPFSERVAWAGLVECIDACIPGDAMHTGTSPLEIVPDWMRAPHVEEARP